MSQDFTKQKEQRQIRFIDAIIYIYHCLNKTSLYLTRLKMIYKNTFLKSYQILIFHDMKIVHTDIDTGFFFCMKQQMTVVL